MRPKRCIASFSWGLSAGSFFAPRPILPNLLSVLAINLNPLIGYACRDHSTLMGTTEYAWQDVGSVLKHFGKRKASTEKSRTKHEPGKPFSQSSTKYLAGLVLNKNVDIKSYGTDLYGRTLGVIYIDGKNVNLEMVKAGLAEVYRGRGQLRDLKMNPIRKLKMRPGCPEGVCGHLGIITSVRKIGEKRTECDSESK